MDTRSERVCLRVQLFELILADRGIMRKKHDYEYTKDSAGGHSYYSRKPWTTTIFLTKYIKLRGKLDS